MSVSPLLDLVPERKRGVKRSIFLVCFNIPWIAAWFVMSRPEADRGLSIPALYCLLVLLVVGMVILPPLMLRRLRSRWLLIVPLALVNIFWALRWIHAFSTNPPHTPNYSELRLVYIVLMCLSSLIVAVVYRMYDSTRDREES